jgi:HK97 family phage prohead protease
MTAREIRTAREAVELRDLAAEGLEGSPRETLVGYASTFRQPYDMGSFWEEVAPGAFSESLAAGDVVALVNHDTAKPLARRSRGNLRLSEDDRGLRVEIDPVDTTYARDLVSAVRAGVVDAMSFGFEVKKDHFEERDGKVVRVLDAVDLHEVSCVTFPANPNADLVLDLRSFDRWRETATPTPPPAPDSGPRRRRLILLPPT